MRKSERPREPCSRVPVRAKATETSLSVALENHLKPSRVYLGPYEVFSPVGVAFVSVKEISEPPGRCG